MIVFEDEASFRQTPTLHATWAARNSQPRIPTRGERNTQKILGAVSVGSHHLAYRHQEDYFNAQTYLSFCEEVLMPAFYRRRHRIFLIQDNASYHKKPEVYQWYARNRSRLEVFLLPPYSPEFNATERIWQYTRKQATHNRFFETPEQLCHSLFTTFADIQKNPQKIAGLIEPYS